MTRETRITNDIRHHFHDPHVSPELRYLTARDQIVCDPVMVTDGIEELVRSALAMVGRSLPGPGMSACRRSTGLR